MGRVFALELTGGLDDSIAEQRAARAVIKAGPTRVTARVLGFVTSETGRVFGSAVVEPVDQEQRVRVNAGKARLAVAGASRRPANFGSRSEPAGPPRPPMRGKGVSAADLRVLAGANRPIGLGIRATEVTASRGSPARLGLEAGVALAGSPEVVRQLRSALLHLKEVAPPGGWDPLDQQLALLDAAVRRQFEDDHGVRMALEGDFLGIGVSAGDGGGPNGAAVPLFALI